VAADVGFRRKHAISVLYTPLFSGMLWALGSWQWAVESDAFAALGPESESDYRGAWSARKQCAEAGPRAAEAGGAGQALVRPEPAPLLGWRD
jgi:hypothetical protein